MRMLVITSAPAYMEPSPRNKWYLEALGKAGLSVPTSDIENESLYLGAASSFAKQARDLFGGYIKGVLKGIECARSQGIKVDLFIVSPRYGIVAECDQLLPYAFSFSKKPKGLIRQFSEKMRTREVAGDLLRKDYDVSVLMINRYELPVLHEPRLGFDLGKTPGRLLVIGAPSLSKAIGGDAKFVPTKSLGERVDLFLNFIDAITGTTLKDF